jgi:hypothetical protein
VPPTNTEVPPTSAPQVRATGTRQPTFTPRPG